MFLSSLRQRPAAGIALIASLAALACAGKTASPDSSSTQRSASQQGEGDPTKTSPPPTSSGPDCVYRNSGGSSGGGSGSVSCMAFDEYSCTSGDKTITCECSALQGGSWSKGSCTCGSLTFPFDCQYACSIGAAEYAKCGLPPPPEDPPNGGGSSGSSGSSSSTSSGG